MIQASVVAPAQARAQPDIPEDDLQDSLWRLAGGMCNNHALIVAEHGLDLMCGLIRRGCLAATVLRPGDKPDADDYDVILVPLLTALPSPDHVIRLARRPLAPNGRLIVGIDNSSAAVPLARRLRLNDFSALHSMQLPHLLLLRADPRRPS